MLRNIPLHLIKPELDVNWIQKTTPACGPRKWSGRKQDFCYLTFITILCILLNKFIGSGASLPIVIPLYFHGGKT